MTKAEAEEAKAGIFAQLDEFEEYAAPLFVPEPCPDLPIGRNAPFTIQRVCELCIRPQEHYKAVGKYLRAIEKSLLVTSTWDSFPNPVSGEAKANGHTITPLSTGLISTPTTPIFSPIPFLHSDARARSKSRSPPQMSLNEPNDAEPAFGRVDELDDPRPGHLSDAPTPISSTTTIATTLQDRFVKGEDQERTPGQGAEVTEQGDKKGPETEVESAGEQSAGEKMNEDKDTEDKTTGKVENATKEGGEDKENQT